MRLSAPREAAQAPGVTQGEGELADDIARHSLTGGRGVAPGQGGAEDLRKVQGAFAGPLQIGDSRKGFSAGPSQPGGPLSGLDLCSGATLGLGPGGQPGAGQARPRDAGGAGIRAAQQGVRPPFQIDQGVKGGLGHTLSV